MLALNISSWGLVTLFAFDIQGIFEAKLVSTTIWGQIEWHQVFWNPQVDFMHPIITSVIEVCENVLYEYWKDFHGIHVVFKWVRPMK